MTAILGKLKPFSGSKSNNFLGSHPIVDHEKRVEALRKTLAAEEGFLVTSRENVRYLSGFTGTAGTVFISAERAVFLTDFRYLSQSEEEVSGMERKVYAKRLEALAETAANSGISRLKFEADNVYYWTYGEICDALKEIDLVPVKGIVESLRCIKDNDELAAMRQAVEITMRAWEETTTAPMAGVRELDLSVELEFRLKRAGSEKAPFDFIVASGPRGALPHGVASERRVQNGELVTFDFGACTGGYFSDLTRTVAVGPVSEELRRIYDLVLEANRAGIAAVRPGIRAREVDAAARRVIDRAGYGEHFGHGTGHGLGLEIHENLRIARGEDRELIHDMVFTVEPGIYAPEVGGVRIEDMVRVTEDGSEVLTSAIPKNLIVVE